MDIVLVSPVSRPLNFREGISEAKTVKFVDPFLIVSIYIQKASRNAT